MKKYMAAFLVTILVILEFCGCTGAKEADASGYVQANLDLIFQGEMQSAKEFLEATDSELEQMHENGIQAFVENYLTGGMDTEGTYAEVYNSLVEQIFISMKYQVGEAKKIGKNSYEVSVEYCPVDIFLNFIPKLKEEAETIEQQAENGAYEGTDEEIQKAMIVDYLNHSYSYLETAYLEMQYGDEEEYIFTVTVKGGIPAMQEEELNTFIERILALDKL